ncbi:hypothetical protein [Paenibacillus sp. P36]|uniref:hypothetical protein n=1 Tax=Paenibacillus sp. P36 TaxID=3342538 RepID=UPI0038B27E61
MYTPVMNENLGSNRWHVFSKKIQREVRLKGDLEYDNWVLIETDPLVLTFCEKPKEIIYSLNGKPIKSVFDMWIKWKDGKEEFVAVNYSYEIDIDHKRHRISAIEKVNSQRLWCEDHSILYTVNRENEIRKNQILLENKKLLLSYMSQTNKADEEIMNAITHKIKSGCTNLYQIENELVQFHKAKVRRLTYNFIVDGIIESNIDRIPLGRATEVYPK